jgi:DNA-binding beta-propeller fold protein YncE/thiol-disulfide isomerase/thioredoxin
MRVDLRQLRKRWMLHVVVVGLLAAVTAASTAGCSPAQFDTTNVETVTAAEQPRGKEVAQLAEEPENPSVVSDPGPSQPQQDVPADKALLPDPFPRKRPAPPLTGGIEWLNTAGPITIESLRGKVVVLDFWTYCCINCMHVLPDLKKLEEKYANQLVVIGVHSAKFETERESQNIREAILRYEIKHPVVNDADMIIWRHFDVQSWPTMWLIDPEGNAVGRISAEGVYEALDFAIDRLVKYHRAKGTMRERPVHFDLEQFRVAETPLRFPGKVLADAASNRLFISDSNHNRIVITTLEGKLIDVVGTGQIGHADGPFDQATFFRPQGMALDGEGLYVADTESHMVRRLDFKARSVSTVAGVGVQGKSRSFEPQPASETALNSPWDLWLHEGKLYIAMAGPHQIWIWDSQTGDISAYAGSGHEDIEDGDLPEAAFAQPSGLTSDGDWLFVADSEGSSIRAVPLIPEKLVWTVVGTADLPARRLFEFGDVDGDNGQARLQHPLGIAWHNGSLYVADTYNNKIKVIDPDKRTCTTFMGDSEPGQTDDPPRFDEPGGLSAAGGKLYVADTNNHTVRVIDLQEKSSKTLHIAGLAPPQVARIRSAPNFPNAERVSFDRQTLAAGAEIELRIQLEVPEGMKLNERAPIIYQVDNADTAVVRGPLIGKAQQVEAQGDRVAVSVATGPNGSHGTLRVSVTYYVCRDGAAGICEIRSAVCEIPVELSASAKQKHVDLVIRPH